MNINFQAFLDTLPIMGLGMLGIFIVIISIMISVKVMTFFSSKNNENN